MMQWIAIGLSLCSLAVSAWTLWIAKTNWPANGFVRVPRELRQEQSRQAEVSESLADRNVTSSSAERQDGSRARVRRARMRR